MTLSSNGEREIGRGSPIDGVEESLQILLTGVATVDWSGRYSTSVSHYSMCVCVCECMCVSRRGYSMGTTLPPADSMNLT